MNNFRFFICTWSAYCNHCYIVNGLTPLTARPSGPRFNIKITSYQYRKSLCGDKTILRPSYLHNGISYTGKTTSLYWIGVQLFINDFTRSTCQSNGLFWILYTDMTCIRSGNNQPLKEFSPFVLMIKDIRRKEMKATTQLFTCIILNLMMQCSYYSCIFTVYCHLPFIVLNEERIMNLLTFFYYCNIMYMLRNMPRPPRGNLLKNF